MSGSSIAFEHNQRDDRSRAHHHTGAVRAGLQRWPQPLIAKLVSAGPDSDQDRTVIANMRGGGSLHPGDKILNDTYVIRRLLGKGGMGEVYEAEHIELGATRAIKIILPEFARNTQYVGLFIEEARKLSRVNNEAIVRYYEFSRDEVGARYLVMEFVAGEPLATILESRRLDPIEIFDLLERLAQGLVAAYDQGIKAHRDISPANVLVPQGRTGQAKIIDFGIAKSADPAGVTLIGSDFAGKYSYMSPEQVGLFGGQEQVTEKSDIYSLGLLLAAAAIGFGKRLDMGNEPASVIRARQSVPTLSGIPGELRPLLNRMLQPRPQDRPESMRALISEARRLRQERGAHRGTDATVPVRGQSRTRKPTIWTLAGGAIGLVLLISAATVVLWPRRPAEEPPSLAAEPRTLNPATPLSPPVSAAAPTTDQKPPNPVSPLNPREAAVPPTPDQSPPPAAAPLSPPVAAAPPTTMAPSPQTVLPPPPPSSVVPDSRAELDEAMKSLDCASLHSGKSTDGAELISGTVPDGKDQAKLLAIAARLPADGRPEIRVDVVPPPVCRSINQFDTLRADNLISASGIEIHLARGVETLHQGDPIAVEVKSLRDYTVHLRIDYFTLGGEVLHMWPNADLPNAVLAAGETREFLKSGPGNKVWQIGGAPFGTELIAVTATPSPLSISTTRPAIEQAAGYLSDLKTELEQIAPPAGEANLAATVLIHTTQK